MQEQSRAASRHAASQLVCSMCRRSVCELHVAAAVCLFRCLGFSQCYDEISVLGKQLLSSNMYKMEAFSRGNFRIRI